MGEKIKKKKKKRRKFWLIPPKTKKKKKKRVALVKLPSIKSIKIIQI